MRREQNTHSLWAGVCALSEVYAVFWNLAANRSVRECRGCSMVPGNRGRSDCFDRMCWNTGVGRLATTSVLEARSQFESAWDVQFSRSLGIHTWPQAIP